MDKQPHLKKSRLRFKAVRFREELYPYIRSGADYFDLSISDFLYTVFLRTGLVPELEELNAPPSYLKMKGRAYLNEHIDEFLITNNIDANLAHFQNTFKKQNNGSDGDGSNS